MNLSAFPPAPAASNPAADLRTALRTGREQTLTHLYQRTFPTVRRYVRRHGGTADDAQDLFHDALVVFYEQAVAGTLVLTAAPSTYLVAVCRNLWRHELARRQRSPVADLPAEAAEVPDHPAPTAEPAESVLTYVEQLGERCRSMLLAFYYFQEPLAHIARTHHYRTVRSATVQKFKCLERLRQAVRHLRAELLPVHA